MEQKPITVRTGETENSADRLTLRPIEDGDRDALAEMLTSSAVNQTYLLPDFDGTDDPKLLRLIGRLTEYSRDDAHFVRGMDVDGKLVGFLNDVEIDGGKIELGWVVHPSCHNRGFCTAAAKAAIRELFGRGFDTVTAGAFEENPASLRVMQKCGMTLTDRVDELEYRGKVHRVINYKITK